MEEVQFEYRDFGLASYLITKGSEFKGMEVRFVKKFNEFKVYVKIQGEKKMLVMFQEVYENNKVKILKDKNIINKINELVQEVKIN